jgi:tripartite-type tricarboxylate transporter receptor subunit TctC
MVPFVEAGSVRPLAVSGDVRSPALPQVPTIGRQGCLATKRSAGSA